MLSSNMNMHLEEEKSRFKPDHVFKLVHKTFLNWKIGQRPLRMSLLSASC